LHAAVLLSYLRNIQDSGKPASEAVFEGAQIRYQPVMLTSLAASLEFIPTVLSQGMGTDGQRPLATVVIGGLVTSTTKSPRIGEEKRKMFAQLGLKATTGGVHLECRTGRGIYGDCGASGLCRKAEDFFYSHNPLVNLSQGLTFVNFQPIEKAVLTESVFFHSDSNLAPNVRLPL